MDFGGLRLTIRDSTPGMVEWRLLSRNGRALGMSRHAFPTPGDARQAFVDVCTRHAGLSAKFHHSLTSTAWTWSVAGDGDSDGAVAVGPRSYGRRGTCASASDRFLAAVVLLAAHPVLVAGDHEAR